MEGNCIGNAVIVVSVLITTLLHSVMNKQNIST
jgi:hypothetical protein